MESNKAFFGALLFIAMVVGANFIMYVIARAAAKPNKKNFLETLGQSFQSPSKNKTDPMSELHSKIRDLNERKKDDGNESK